MQLGLEAACCSRLFLDLCAVWFGSRWLQSLALTLPHFDLASSLCHMFTERDGDSAIANKRIQSNYVLEQIWCKEGEAVWISEVGFEVG